MKKILAQKNLFIENQTTLFIEQYFDYFKSFDFKKELLNRFSHLTQDPYVLKKAYSYLNNRHSYTLMTYESFKKSNSIAPSILFKDTAFSDKYYKDHSHPPSFGDVKSFLIEQCDSDKDKDALKKLLSTYNCRQNFLIFPPNKLTEFHLDRDTFSFTKIETITFSNTPQSGTAFLELPILNPPQDTELDIPSIKNALFQIYYKLTSEYIKQCDDLPIKYTDLNVWHINLPNFLWHKSPQTSQRLHLNFY